MGNCIGLLISPEPKPSVITPSFSNPGLGRFMKKRRIRRFYEARRSSSASASADESDRSSTVPNGENILERSRGPNYLRSFSYEELSSATNSFDLKSMLGEGGFGRVYKGWIDFNNVNMNMNLKSTLSSKNVVAIKKLNSGSVQGFEEWQSEVNFLGSLSHPNLVNLFGYCWEHKDLLLVYEYMPKGSLENHLFRRSVPPLSWDRRISIALGAARGLAFLHTNLDRQVIYRDFKASNVLLDENYNAKLSDFGLAKIGPSGENSHVTTRIMGTFGYAAPEYMATGRLYVKSDVYGFGVVLLEILTGLLVIDSKRPIGKQNLIEWTRNSLSNKTRLLSNIMDSRIKGQYSSKAALETARLAHRCLRLDPSSRPSMTQVVEALQLIKATNLVHNKSKQA